ncbi:MAG: hypothetical protein WAT22_13525 [Saprospiraceae bacterium]|jgi:hypothetical protein|nr:outer membrane beta-barrel protein [Saprospiraceae bacterium]MBP6446679.1 outer membrane beta-barrel protein [Saprospiraceae bacterium]
MKNLLIFAFAMMVSFAGKSQFYVSGGAGYTLGMPEQILGINTVQTSATATSTTNNYGTYGAGTNLRLNLGYFFNDKLGVDLGFAYLMGKQQDVTTFTYAAANASSYQKATSTAIGFAPALVYKLNGGLYGRFGIATKVGGKVDVDIYGKQPFSGAPTTAYTETKAKAEIHGQPPFGFIGALGYEISLGKLGLFAEAEYLGINVKRKSLTMNEFDTSVYQNNGTLIQAGAATLEKLPPGNFKEVTYKESATSPQGAEQLSLVSPYSSLGINIGVKFSFK